MKYISIPLNLLLVAIAFPFLLVSQNYIPFPDSGAVWKETYCWQPSPFFYNGIGDTYIEGDTVINDTVYKKIYNLSRDVFCSDIILSGPEYIGALREDYIEKKVFFRWHLNTEEKLIYDYSLQIGDTLSEYIGSFCPYYVYVSDIDTIITNDNVIRRVWILDYEEQEFPGWPQIIEGIGSTSGLLGNIEPYWEGWNELLCFEINDELIWRSFRDTCYVITDSCAPVGINKRNFSNSIIKYFPNPVAHNSLITFSINRLYTKNNYLMIYNLYGNELYGIKFSNPEFNIKSPPKIGIYVGKAFFNNKQVTFKILVN